jgi:hypothetical protein
MLILAWVAVVRVTGSQNGNSPAAEYAVFTLLAVAVGLVVLIFIRAGARRSSKPNLH